MLLLITCVNGNNLNFVLILFYHSFLFMKIFVDQSSSFLYEIEVESNPHSVYRLTLKWISIRSQNLLLDISI